MMSFIKSYFVFTWENTESTNFDFPWILFFIYKKNYMPELPEVEVVKRSLKKKIENLVIKKVKINDANLRYKLDKREISKLIGKKIKKLIEDLNF